MIHYGLLFFLAGTSAVGALPIVNDFTELQRLSSHSTLSASCPESFVQVGDRCLHFDISVIGTWQEMREFCQQKNSDLVVLSDPQFYYEVIQYLKTTAVDSSFWIGATDLEKEGQWVWNDGTPVSMGTPFWANFGCDNAQMPTGGTSQNCGILDKNFHLYFNDIECEWSTLPMCELSSSKSVKLN